MKKAEARLRWKIFDLVDDLHKKTAHFLVTRFDHVMLPFFETSKMVTKLVSKTGRQGALIFHRTTGRRTDMAPVGASRQSKESW